MNKINSDFSNDEFLNNREIKVKTICQVIYDLILTNNLKSDEDKEISVLLMMVGWNKKLNLEEYPYEKILSYSISIINGLKNNTIKIDVEKYIPKEMYEIIDATSIKTKDIIVETFIKLVNDEILEHKDISNSKLLDYKLNLQLPNLTKELEKCINEENYEQAAIIRDKINKLKK